MVKDSPFTLHALEKRKSQFSSRVIASPTPFSSSKVHTVEEKDPEIQNKTKEKSGKTLRGEKEMSKGSSFASSCEAINRYRDPKLAQDCVS